MRLGPTGLPSQTSMQTTFDTFQRDFYRYLLYTAKPVGSGLCHHCRKNRSNYGGSKTGGILLLFGKAATILFNSRIFYIYFREAALWLGMGDLPSYSVHETSHTVYLGMDGCSLHDSS